MRFKLLFLAVVALGIFVRLYHFPERVTLSMEQGMTLSTTASYLYDKFSLLGMTNVQRVTQAGHMVLVNPLYNYFLMPFMLLLGKDPIRLTYLSVFINLFTALVLYLVSVYLTRNRRISLLATFLFLFNATMIEQSLTIWIHNAVPLLGVLTLYLLVRLKRQEVWWIALALGLLSGLGYALEYLYLATAGLVGVLLLVYSRARWRTFFLYLLGFLLPQVPVLAFDFRHDWYNLRTLWEYALETFHRPSETRLNWYHFFQFFPLAAILGGMLLNWFWKRATWFGLFLTAVYFYYNLSLPSIDFGRAKPPLTAPDIIGFSQTISQNITNPDFNLVYKPDSEYRAYVLRYLLTYIYGKAPLSFEAYPSSQEIFVVSRAGENLLVGQPWEISAFGPKSQTLLSETQDKQYALYKLTR